MHHEIVIENYPLFYLEKNLNTQNLPIPSLRHRSLTPVKRMFII